jgi:hypothetical protein
MAHGNRLVLDVHLLTRAGGLSRHMTYCDRADGLKYYAYVDGMPACGEHADVGILLYG